MTLFQSLSRIHPRCMIDYNQVRTSFYNPYRHGPTKATEPEPLDYGKTLKRFFGKEGLEFIKSEVVRISRKPFRKKKFRTSRHILNKFEDFNDDGFLKHWQAVTDSDAGHGFSTASITRSVNNHALFRGYLDTRIPQDGMIQMSGFAAMVGPKQKPDSILQTENPWDWSNYNSIEVKLRGDGRKYNIVINTSRDDTDFAFFDTRSYPLFTSGGPYWQTFRVPLSKFVLTYKGVIQDEHFRFPTEQVQFVGLTLCDTISGPFALEVDYIGLIYDSQPFNEVTAYETYNHPHIRLRPLQVESRPPDSVP